VLDDLDVAGMDMRVGLNEVVANNGSELLGGIDWVLLGEDVCGLFLGVGSNNDRVVCMGVASRC
jgi:hypothetical protein